MKAEGGVASDPGYSRASLWAGNDDNGRQGPSFATTCSRIPTLAFAFPIPTYESPIPCRSLFALW